MRYKCLVVILALLLTLQYAYAKPLDSLYAGGRRCFEVGDYAGMLEFYSKALKLTENGPCPDKALACFKVGTAYYFLQERPTSLEHFYQVLSLERDCPDSLLTKTLRIIGSLHFELSKLDSARYYLEEAERLLLKTDKWGELSTLYAIMGEVYEEKDDYYFNLSEKYAIKTNDTSQMAFAYVKQGSNALESGNCAEAIRYLNLGLHCYQKTHYPDGEMYALRELAKTYSTCGNADSLYNVFNLYNGITNNIFKEETAEKTAHYRTLYETEKKERENIELSKNRRQLIVVFVFSVLILILVFIIAYSRYRLKKQRELATKISEQQQLRFAAVIEAEEKERQRIATDLHDGLGQIMSAAKINLSSIQDEIAFKDEEQRGEFQKIVALIDESCKEVRAVSHSMMPNTLLKSGLANAIRNFLNQINQKAIEINFYSEGLDEKLDTNTEIILYRVIQECVNNVIKHSQATKLHISLIKDEDSLSVTIEDNGKGFDASIIKDADGLGLKNIQTRIGYLNGKVEWDTAPDKGTVVMIHIPLE